jgi:histone-lysine N-methyltransferase SETD3
MVYMLINRREPNSFFKPYYDILPATLNSMPIFWNEEEMGWLKGSHLTEQTKDRKEAIKNDYDQILEVAPEFAEVATLDEFSWARMIVCSRNFGLVINGLRTSALVPYADMLNHLRPRETKWTFDNKIGCFTITALQGIGAGAQVYDSYGKKCNHRFLLNYGFSLENNVEEDGSCPNEVAMMFELDQEEHLFPLKLALWRSTPPVQHTIVKRLRIAANGFANTNTRQALSLLRVLVANEAETKYLSSMHATSNVPGRSRPSAAYPICLRNERAMVQKLQILCNKMLADYPETVEEDDALLVEGKLEPFSNHRHAVIHRRGEKRVLLTYLEAATESIRVLNEPTPKGRWAEASQLMQTDGMEDIAELLMEEIGHLVRHDGPMPWEKGIEKDDLLLVEGMGIEDEEEKAIKEMVENGLVNGDEEAEKLAADAAVVADDSENDVTSDEDEEGSEWLGDGVHKRSIAQVGAEDAPQPEPLSAVKIHYRTIEVATGKILFDSRKAAGDDSQGDSAPVEFLADEANASVSLDAGAGAGGAAAGASNSGPDAVLPGIHLGVLSMNVGERALFRLSGEGIGDKGTVQIAGNTYTDLEVDVELLQVRPYGGKEKGAMSPEEKALAAEKIKEMGNNRFRQKDWDRATDRYMQAIQFVDDGLPAGGAASFERELRLSLWLNLGASNLKLEQFESAVKSCDAALELDPKHVKALYRRGCALMGLDAWAEAKANFRTALELDPNNKGVRRELREAMEQIKGQKQAEKTKFAGMFQKLSGFGSEVRAVFGFIRWRWLVSCILTAMF